MTDLGTYKGKRGLEILLKEINSLLLVKKTVVIAVAGLPGTGKTHLVKNFIRFGFGNFHRRNISVIDDGHIYSTRFWKLNWTKINGDRKTKINVVNSINTKIVFYSTWRPSRSLDFADLMIYIETNEQKRLDRLKRRYKKTPEKFLIQKEKKTIPIESPFLCDKYMTLSNNSHDLIMWSIVWIIRRLLSH